MTLTAQVNDLGTCFYGSNPTFTLTFGQGATVLNPTGTPTDPGSAQLKMTPPGGKSTDYSASLTHVTAGVYTFSFNASAPGDWTGRAYAPPGSGQTSMDIVVHVMETANP